MLRPDRLETANMPHSKLLKSPFGAGFELQQYILTMSTGVNALSCSYMIGRLDIFYVVWLIKCIIEMYMVFGGFLFMAAVYGSDHKMGVLHLPLYFSFFSIAMISFLYFML